MFSQDDIDNENHWTTFAALCLLIASCFGAIGYGFITLLAHWSGPPSANATWLEYLAKAGPMASLKAAVVAIAWLAPGVLFWRLLRRRNRYAALYGLLLAAATSIGMSALMGYSNDPLPPGEAGETQRDAR